jgi:drug/metabolite transporter (DMT)-like permease
VGFPVAASILAWHEIPSPKQTVGLVLIVIALLLFGRHEATGGKRE